VAEYLDQMEKVRVRLAAKRILPGHLIGCDFTVRPADVKVAAEARGLAQIPVLLDADETLTF
jgi:hypothetical protein